MSEFQKAGTFDNPIEIVDDIIDVDDLSDDDISDDFTIIYDSEDEESHINCVSSDNIPINPHSDQEFVDDDDDDVLSLVLSSSDDDDDDVDVLSLVLSSSDDECAEPMFPESLKIINVKDPVPSWMESEMDKYLDRENLSNTSEQRSKKKLHCPPFNEKQRDPWSKYEWQGSLHRCISKQIWCGNGILGNVISRERGLFHKNNWSFIKILYQLIFPNTSPRYFVHDRVWEFKFHPKCRNGC